ncbi:MAG: SgcJ/EcaC family oxidoreductase [Woeseiaceae bacterium]
MNKIRRAFMVVCIVFTFPSPADSNDATEKEAIVSVIDGLTDAWQAGDGDAWADAFVDDADFTIWFGMGLKGKEQIAWGHQLIFDSFYADTVFKLDVQQIRFLGNDVAIAHLRGEVVKGGEERTTEPDAVPLAVLHRSDGVWKIVAFQNTPFVVNEFRTNGDIKRFKRLAAEQSQIP